MGNYARLRSLVTATDEPTDQAIQAVLDQAADRLSDFDESAVVQVRLVPARGAPRAWSMRTGGDQRRAEAGRAERPDLEVVTSAETLQRVADGSYSPIQAFIDGRLRVRGDAELGKRVVRHLGGPDGDVDVC